MLVAGLLAAAAPIGVDYLAPTCVTHLCDDASGSIDALAAGDLHGFFAQQPPMGSFSLLVRAPLAAIAKASGASELTSYRLGAFACLLAVAALAFFLARMMEARGRSWIAWTIVPALALANPLTQAALAYGHPEELLGAALAVGAVLLSARNRPLAAGFALGCAIATKQWAALAVLPALLAAPRGTRRRLAVAAVGTAAVLTVPMIAGDAGRFFSAQRYAGAGVSFSGTVTASNVWWPFATALTTGGINGAGQHALITQFSLAPWLGALTHPLAIAAALALSAGFARPRDRDPLDALALLALVFLLRCVLDPLTYSYHHAPFLIALVAYESLRRRIPLASLYAIGATYAMTHVIAPLDSAAAVNSFHLAWTLPLCCYLGLVVLRPRARSRPVSGSA